MSRVGWLLAVIVGASACGAPTEPQLAGPMDGSDAGAQTPADDAGVDGSPIDAALPDAEPEPTDLAVVCGGKAPVTFDEWEACYHKRKCEWEVGCFPTYPFTDAADCIAFGDAVSGGALAIERRDRKRAVAQGHASIDVANFTQCLLRTSATHCNTSFHEAACLNRFTGTVNDDNSCVADIDCKSPGALCNTDCPDACCIGTCERKLRKDEACVESESCEPGLVCTGSKCVTGDIGTPCAKSPISQCDFGAYCDTKAGRCVATLPRGAACTSLAQCGEDDYCVGLSITGSQPGQCLRVSKPGDRCDDFCFGNLYCDKSTKPGTCHSFPVLGESCAALGACAGAEVMCDSGRCVRRDDVGTSCVGQTCLPGLFCSDAVADPDPRCAARRANGMPCNDASQCESYLCAGDPGTCQRWSNTCP